MQGHPSEHKAEIMATRKPTRPTIMQALAAAPRLRIELAPGFACDLAVIEEVGVDGFCLFHSKGRTSLPTGARQPTMADRRVHANYIKRVAKGMTLDQALELVAEGKRASTLDAMLESAELARGFVEGTARAAAQHDQALAA